jgi:hypothetical protein
MAGTINRAFSTGWRDFFDSRTQTNFFWRDKLLHGICMDQVSLPVLKIELFIPICSQSDGSSLL